MPKPRRLRRTRKTRRMRGGNEPMSSDYTEPQPQPEQQPQPQPESQNISSGLSNTSSKVQSAATNITRKAKDLFNNFKSWLGISQSQSGGRRRRRTMKKRGNKKH